MLITGLLLIFFGTCLITGFLRFNALKMGLLDIPNQRSSHSIPTPRGGGLSFYILFSLSMLILLFTNQIDISIALILIVGGSGIAATGFIDDHVGLSAKYRLLIHFLICFFTVHSLGVLPLVSLYYVKLSSTVILSAFATLYLVWFLNLFNFMDGIDGLAGVEAITCCFGVAILYYISNQTGLVNIPLILGAAVAGFLIWNFPPAKIFMGDVGSGFLGYILGVLSLIAAQANLSLLGCWMILMAVFVCDATLTLFRRAYFGEHIFEAHNSHTYQFFARRKKSHLWVTRAVFLLNIFWLFPIALNVVLNNISLGFGLLCAYLPLLIIGLKFNDNNSNPSIDAL